MDTIKKQLPTPQAKDIQELYNEVTLTTDEMTNAVADAMRAKKRELKEGESLDLTVDEKEWAFMEARREKVGRQNLLNYKLKLQSPKSSFPVYTAEEYLEQVYSTFVVDEWNRDLIWQLCLYFSEDKRCELDFKKGIYIMGPVGCGKSSLLEFFHKNQWNSFVIASCISISEVYQQNGIEGVNRFKHIHTAPLDAFPQKEIGFLFDDLGMEVDKKNYGNEDNVMQKIILARYNNRKSLEAHTHITTNYNKDELDERYGYLIRSRLRELCNVLAFNEDAPDRRK